MERVGARRERLKGEVLKEAESTLERLVREVAKLVSAMESDGVPVCMIRVPDAPHDVLMMGLWDEKVRDEAWNSVESWVQSVTGS